MTPPSLREPAPAKLNLYLHITGRRPDGYHLLDSLIVFVDLCDVLEAVPSNDITLRLRGPFAAGVDPGEGNLVMRAARLLRETTGMRAGAAMTLHKHIPVGAGVGGGSADAAAALRLLMRLWDARLSQAALYALAARLGSDVPACLASQPCRVAGVGDVLGKARLDCPIYVVLAHPGRPLLTAEVYRAFDGAYTAASPFDCAGLSAADMAICLRQRRNDLEPPALCLLPEVGEVLSALNNLPACLLARMSGSGSACFALFAARAEAEEAAARLRAEHPRWWAAPASLWRAGDDGKA